MCVCTSCLQHHLESLTEEDFGRHRQALSVKRSEKPKKLKDECGKYWGEILSRQYHFVRGNHIGPPGLSFVTRLHKACSHMVLAGLIPRPSVPCLGSENEAGPLHKASNACALQEWPLVDVTFSCQYMFTIKSHHPLIRVMSAISTSYIWSDLDSDIL